MFETNFPEQVSIWGHKNIWGGTAPSSSVSMDLAAN